MKATVTNKVTAIANKVAGNGDYKEKATRIWKHVRDIPYDVFGIVTRNVDALLDNKSLTCYGKAMLQASMLESEGIPWRFEISSCQSSNVSDTIHGIGNPLVTKLFDTFPGLFRGNELMHASVQVNIDGDWKRMDSTIPIDVCEKIKNVEKRNKCKSMDNVTAMHDCHVTGYSKELPEGVVGAWNVISKAGKWATGKIKDTPASW